MMDRRYILIFGLKDCRSYVGNTDFGKELQSVAVLGTNDKPK